MPRMSCPPSTVDSTERSWMPRFSATDAIPPVRQLARPTRRYSIGVMPSSSAAKTSGWSASNVHSCLWLCSSPRPKKLWTLIVLCTPLCHLADARQVNWAASGAPFSTSRASSSACTLTPLVTVVISADSPLALLPIIPMEIHDNIPAWTSADIPHGTATADPHHPPPVASAPTGPQFGQLPFFGGRSVLNGVKGTVFSAYSSAKHRSSAIIPTLTAPGNTPLNRRNVASIIIIMANSLASPQVTDLLSRLFAAADEDDDRVPPLPSGLSSWSQASASQRADALQDCYIPISADAGKLLYNLVRSARPDTVVEFGTSFGISTIYLAAAVTDNGAGRVLGTELSPRKVAAAGANLREAGVDGPVTILPGDALETLADLPGPVGLALLDGWKDLCLPVLRLLEPRLAPGALVVADDITFASMADYLAYVRDPARGYVSV